MRMPSQSMRSSSRFLNQRMTKNAAPASRQRRKEMSVLPTPAALRRRTKMPMMPQRDGPMTARAMPLWVLSSFAMNDPPFVPRAKNIPGNGFPQQA